MKKLVLITFIAISLILLQKSVNAQSQRLVMFEEFTQASCPPCAATNPGLNALLDANPTKITALKYQTSWPGIDPMNAQNPTQVADRVTYYNVTGVPNGIEDGNVYNDQPSTFTQADINTEYAVPSPFTLDVTHTFNTAYDSIFITCKIKCTQALTVTGPLVCQTAIIEKHIHFATEPGTNGETDFYEVMREMLPTDAGTTMATTWAVGDSMTINFAVKLPTYIYNVAEVAIVSFIQDNSTKFVEQAGYSAPRPVPLDASISNIYNVPTSLSCTASFTPKATLLNAGTTTITSATISYQVDGGTAVTQPWTGSLAYGDTASITLPLVTGTTSGAHTYKVSVSAPNGGTDQNSGNDAITKSFNLSLSTPAALPLTEGFIAATFPPTNWNIINPGGGATWARVATVGGFGYSSNSAKYDFYDITGGNTGDLISPSLDLSSATQAKMTFSVAYARYEVSGFPDELQVLVSTDCGTTWSKVYDKTGAALLTAPDDSVGAFVPTAAQWRSDTVNLSSYIGQSKVFISFHAISGYGNNLYLDDINISSTVGINEIPNSGNSVSVYPNPFNSSTNVEINLSKTSNVSVDVYNVVGQKVTSIDQNTYSAGTHTLKINGENLSQGLYYLVTEINGQKYTQKITVVK